MPSAMSPSTPRVLIAGESGRLFQLVQQHASQELFAGQPLRPVFCLAEELETRLHEFEIDALMVTQSRFQADFPAAVRRWRSLKPDLEVLFLFRRLPHTREIVELMRAGACDVLETDFDLSDRALREAIASLFRRLEEARSGDFERRQARQTVADLGLIGESVEMQNLFVQVTQAAGLTLPALVSGPPGVGKRLIAHAIHTLSPRNARPVVMVDCGALSPMLLEAALFGRGATLRHGTEGLRRGNVLDAARRGTLVLNEIGETPYPLQLELLRLIEHLEDDETASLDVRIISTSSRKLDELVETRHFSAELSYKLRVLSLEAPPLRRRTADIPLLARYFLSRYERDGHSLALSEEAMAALHKYDWPGNVRELKAALEYAFAHSLEATITKSSLPDTVAGRGRHSLQDRDPLLSNELNLARLEEQAILRALHVSGFDKAKTAKLLGIGKTTMYRKLKAISAKARRAD